MQEAESQKGHKVLVFGNPMVKVDSMPLKLIGQLRERFPEIQFEEFDPAENLEKEGRNLNIIDSVEGIGKVALITDINSIETQRVYSMHDFDLGHSLKLLKKLGYLDGVKIFAVPMKISRREALEQLTETIRATLL